MWLGLEIGVESLPPLATACKLISNPFFVFLRNTISYKSLLTGPKFTVTTLWPRSSSSFDFTHNYVEGKFIWLNIALYKRRLEGVMIKNNVTYNLLQFNQKKNFSIVNPKYFKI